MKKLSEYIQESLTKKEPEILYHFSYDIINSSDDYDKKKNDLEKVINDTKPLIIEYICESSIILGYDKIDFDLFKILEDNLKKDIIYCLSIVIKKDVTNQFQIKDSNKVLSKKINAK